MKLNRRGMLGTMAGATAAMMDKQAIAAKHPPSQIPMPAGSGYTPDWSNISEIEAPPLSYWRDMKERAEKILRGDFSDVNYSGTAHLSSTIDDLKSISAAGKRMIMQQRYIDEQKRHYIENAKQELKAALKALGLTL